MLDGAVVISNVARWVDVEHGLGRGHADGVVVGSGIEGVVILMIDEF